MGFIISAFKLFCWAAFCIALLHTLISALLLWVERRSPDPLLLCGDSNGCGHLGLLFSKAVIAKLAHWISN